MRLYGMITPGLRSVTSIRSRTQIVGWQFHCYDCSTHKNYLSSYFDEPRKIAVAMLETHVCREVKTNEDTQP